jgi:hypothetical protein
MATNLKGGQRGGARRQVVERPPGMGKLLPKGKPAADVQNTLIVAKEFIIADTWSGRRGTEGMGEITGTFWIIAGLNC